MKPAAERLNAQMSSQIEEKNKTAMLEPVSNSVTRGHISETTIDL